MINSISDEDMKEEPKPESTEESGEQQKLNSSKEELPDYQIYFL